MTPVQIAAATLTGATFTTTATLRSEGWRKQEIADAVAAGAIIRLRQGRFTAAAEDGPLISAGRLGGRLDCLSLLGAIGVYVRDDARLHVQFEPGTGRLPPRGGDVVAHWRVTTTRRQGRLATDMIEALAQACRCQSREDAVATLDSAWCSGLVDSDGIAAVFARLPESMQDLHHLLDPRSESGPETLLRLILEDLGCRIDVQVRISGVGRVDFLVDGWLIVECDSRGFHDGWDAHRRDRRRDVAAAALGYATIRPIAEDILHRPDAVRRQLRAAITHGRPAATPRHSHPAR